MSFWEKGCGAFLYCSKRRGRGISRQCGIASTANLIKTFITENSKTLGAYICSWLCTYGLRMHMHAQGCAHTLSVL